MRWVLYAAFAASGMAGLLYELGWSRYLALLVGHAAYAQVLVIAVFLGGLAVGSLLVGRRSRALRWPLVWYAAAEGVLCVGGLSFHPVFGLVSRLSYDHVLPALGSPALISLVQWGLAALLILPQSVLLGTTFPLMSAGLLRADPHRTARTVSLLYGVNSLGGAVGILLGGFLLVAWAGLPALVMAGGGLSGLAAILAFAAHRATAARSVDAATLSTRAQRERPWTPAPGAPPDALWRFLLAASFLTALASFTYEIAWIRMLSLVMGSATHSFEIMLSAFILGLGLGSVIVGRVVERSSHPLRALGWVQWAMGATALATLFLYQESFAVMAYAVRGLPDREHGYALFNLARYGIGLAVMLPSTLCAGMTLPLITGTLLHAGVGERALGGVYGLNTLGSVAGVCLAGLVALPLLGLEGLLAAGAAVDMGLGVAVLAFGARRGWSVPRRSVLASGALGLLVLVVVTTAVRLDRRALTGGVYRYGSLPRADDFELLFYADGRTATVGVHRLVDPGLTVLSTNGKPDASLGDRWLAATHESLPPEPIYWQDESTQLMAAVVALAHAPRARDAAMIGHGSGVTSHFLLAKPDLRSLVTVEIEPLMLAASREFYPANERALEDPRASMVIDDAKAYFSQQRRRYDLILSEPSNPWVSGTSSLFTREFYRRVGDFLSPEGVFAQWIQIYELTDGAVATVLAALEASFGDYRAFLVGDSDLLIVATPAGSLAEPDWSVVRYPGIADEIRHVNPLTPGHLAAMRVFDRQQVSPLLRDFDPVNSDYFPHLDLAAEKGRFLNSFALGLYGLTRDRFDVVAALAGRRIGFPSYEPVPVWGIPRMRARAVSGWIRSGAPDPVGPDAPSTELRMAAQRHAGFLRLLDGGAPPPQGWVHWTETFRAVERDLHRGTAGVADTAFYRQVQDYVASQDAPSEVRAAVDFMHGIAAWEWGAATEAADVILEQVGGAGPTWIDPGTLLDGAVTARILSGDPPGAARVLERLLPATGRKPDDFRVLLLRAYAAR